MTYQEPRMIQEARPKGKFYLLAAIIAVTLVAAVMALYYRTLNRPVTAPPETRLENALRAGDQGFEQDRKMILVEGLNATQSTRALGDVVMELMATVKNTTGRTLNGLELRGAVVDAQGAPVGERTVIVIPARQATLKPDETLNVRVLIEGIKPDADRSNILMEVTGIRFE
jgi:hypothetical protein